LIRCCLWRFSPDAFGDSTGKACGPSRACGVGAGLRRESRVWRWRPAVRFLSRGLFAVAEAVSTVHAEPACGLRTGFLWLRSNCDVRANCSGREAKGLLTHARFFVYCRHFTRFFDTVFQAGVQNPLASHRAARKKNESGFCECASCSGGTHAAPS